MDFAHRDPVRQAVLDVSDSKGVPASPEAERPNPAAAAPKIPESARADRVGSVVDVFLGHAPPDPPTDYSDPDRIRVSRARERRGGR